MSNLDTLLDRAGDVDSGPVDVDQLVDQSRQRRRTRRVVLATTGATLSLVLVAALLAVTQQGTRPVQVASGADPSSLPSRWEQRQAPEDATEIKRIATVGGKTLAVGATGGPTPGSTTPAIWTATSDGWTRVYADLPVPHPKSGQVSDVTYFNGQFIAVGQRLATIPTNVSTNVVDVIAGVWTSTDGRTWKTVDDPLFSPPTPPILPTHSPARTSIARIAVGPQGLFAFGQTFVGVYNAQLKVGQDALAATVWTSADGNHWSGAPLVLPGASAPSIRAAVRMGDEVLIAGSRGWTAGAWASSDGQTWRAVPVDEVGGSDIAGLATAGGRVVAVGTANAADDQPEAVVWMMTDAGRLERATLNGDVHGVELKDVVGTSAGFLATGWSSPNPSLVSWTSTNGLTWQAVARDGTVFQRNATATAAGVADGLFVIAGHTISGSGSDEDPKRPRSALWYGQS